MPAPGRPTMTRRPFVLLALAAPMAPLALATGDASVAASPPSGVTPTVLARGTYDRYKVKASLHPAQRLSGRGQGADRHRRAPA